MRLFIAIDTEGEFRDELIETIEDLKSWSYEGSFTDADSLHLTLAFLGERRPEEISGIKDAMIMAVSRLIPPLELSLEGIGRFKSRGKGSVYYRRIKNDDKLRWLAQRLRQELGIYDDKPFKPHITLARRCSVYDDFDRDEFDEGLGYVTCEVENIILYESTLTSRGPVYTPVFTLNI